MLDNSEEFQYLMHTVREIAKADRADQLLEVLEQARPTIQQTSYDNWNGGIYGNTVSLEVDVKTFIRIKDDIEGIERLLLDRFSLPVRHIENENIDKVAIVPKTYAIGARSPNPHRPFTPAESKRREELISYLSSASEDDLIAEILLCWSTMLLLLQEEKSPRRQGIGSARSLIASNEARLCLWTGRI